MAKLFTAPDEWAGGHYEVAMEFRGGNVALAQAAVTALWTHPMVGRCYLRSDVEPEDQRAIDVVAEQRHQRLFGTCVLAGVRVAALSVVIPHDAGPVWVYFGFPMASLRRAYSVGGYPYDEGTSLGWRDEVDKWLRTITTAVFAQAPFDCALIAHEVEESVADELAEGRVPAKRWEGILLATAGGLAWYPPTEGAPFTFDR